MNCYLEPAEARLRACNEVTLCLLYPMDSAFPYIAVSGTQLEVKAPALHRSVFPPWQKVLVVLPQRPLANVSSSSFIFLVSFSLHMETGLTSHHLVLIIFKNMPG